MPKSDKPRVESNITFDDARLIYRNFRGEGSQFNAEGNRNFSVVVPEELADQLAQDGWNVKCRVPKEEGDEKLCHLPVAVGYKGNRPPRITLITSKGRTELDEETVNTLDYADIAHVDLVVRPYNWEMPTGASGVKAYLKTMFVTLNEDELELRYAENDQQYPPSDGQGE